MAGIISYADIFLLNTREEDANDVWRQGGCFGRNWLEWHHETWPRKKDMVVLRTENVEWNSMNWPRTTPRWPMVDRYAGDLADHVETFHTAAR